MAPEAVSTFLDESITHRISDRLIAEQHIAVSRALQHPLETFKPLGVLNFKCSPMEMIRMCSIFVHDLCEATYGIAPTIQVEGAVDARFPYVLEFA
jgi:26S proteasome regulatory subunit T1